MLPALQDPDSGAVGISQAEMAAELEAKKPAVNRGFKELKQASLAWLLRRGCCQLHPVLTSGRVAGAAMTTPEINTTPAEDFTEQRRCASPPRSSTSHKAPERPHRDLPDALAPHCPLTCDLDRVSGEFDRSVQRAVCGPDLIAG